MRSRTGLVDAESDRLLDGLFLASEATFIIRRDKRIGGLRKNFVFAMSQNEYDEMGFWPPLKEYNKDRIRKEFPWKKVPCSETGSVYIWHGYCYRRITG